MSSEKQETGHRPVVLITGGGSGVGRAAAESFVQAGYRVALVGRRREKLEETRSHCGEAFVYPADVSDPEAVTALIRAVAEHWAAPAVLVNNAGLHGEFATIEESDPERWRQTLLVNVYAPYLLSRAVLPAMKERGWGRILNVSSAAALAPPGNRNSVYPLTKQALNLFTRQLAVETEGSGVTAHALHPGEVKSEMWAAIRDDVFSREGEATEGMQGWARMVDETGGDPPEKAAALMVELCGPEFDERNGEFHWIPDGIQAPRPAW